MPICCYCGFESYIKYGKHFLCRKHYHNAVNLTFDEAIKKCSENTIRRDVNGKKSYSYV